MGHFIASMCMFVYDSAYTQSGTYKILTTYSDAIMGAIGPDGTMHTVYLMMKTAAIGLLVVYFIIALGTKMESMEVSSSMVFRTFLEFFAGFALITCSFDIVYYMFQLGDGLAALLVDTGSSLSKLSSYTDAFAESISNLSIITEVGYVLKAIPAYLVCLITEAAIIYLVVTRVLRVCVCAAMSPIAVANCFDGARHSDAVRFLKKTFAMCLQCSVIMVIIAAMTNISQYVNAGAVNVDPSGIETADGKTVLTVEEAKKQMLDSAEINSSRLSKDISLAIDKLGYSAYNDAYVLKSEYSTAQNKLKGNDIEKIKKEKEAEYKKYEKALNIKIFQRDSSGNYKYTKNGNAKIKNKYKIFGKEETTTFIDVLFGGAKGFMFILMASIKVGLIKKSISLCNTIVGV